MKKTLSIILITTLFIFSGCNINIPKKSESSSELDNLYFIEWNSYHAYYKNENPIIQLNFVQYQSNEIPSFEKLILISENEEFSSALLSINKGSEGKTYELYTLVLEMPKLEEGNYKITKLKLKDNNDYEKIYDIGLWNIEVIENQNNNDLNVGKRSLGSTIFDWYQVELRNISDSKILIKNLEIKLDNINPDINIKSSSDFNMTQIIEEKPYLTKKQTKTFKFEFTNIYTDDPLFISIRPVLNYEVNSTTQYIILPTAIYSPSLEDNEIINLIKQKHDL